MTTVEELKEAAWAYYAGEEPLMSDEEFDAAYSTLKDSLGSDPSLGSLVGQGKVPHNPPMLSQAKAKSLSELKAFFESTSEADGWKFQVKLDGFALAASFKDGELIQMSTRGDGQAGDDVSYCLTEPRLTFVGLPSRVDGFTGELRGEVFFTFEQFRRAVKAQEDAGLTPFTNSRNGVVGVIRGCQSGLTVDVEVSFAAYGAYDRDGSLTSIPEGVLTVDDLTLCVFPDAPQCGSRSEVEQAVELFRPMKSSLPFPVDGVVIRSLPETVMNGKLGFTSHHPLSQVAFKYPGEEVEATVEEITLTVGKTGRLTPTATITPVSLGGSTITFVSLHNPEWMSSRCIGVGSKVAVTKAGDVIPSIVRLISNGPDVQPYVFPKKCPYCLVSLEDYTCVNTACPSRVWYVLNYAFGRGGFNVKGLSGKTLSRLADDGIIRTPSDVFALTAEDLKGCGLGAKTASNLMKEIEKAKVSTPPEKILVALGVDGIGPATAKALLASFGSLDGVVAASFEELTAVPGVGSVQAHTILDRRRYLQRELKALRECGVKLEHEVNDKEDADLHLTSLSFALSGPVPKPFHNRQEWVDYVESHGGVFHSSPKADTGTVIGDPGSTSSKMMKAKKLGLTVMSPDEWTGAFYR